LVESTEAPPSIEQLRKVVLGDMWVKDSRTDKPSDFTAPTDQAAFSPWRNNHIAIVASVPDDPENISDPQVFMDQIILIEGEFTNKIQSVIKKLSVGDYNRSEIPYNFPIYSNFSTPKQGEGAKIKLNCQSWAIRRLK
jgi:hypothetical protein